MPWVLIGRVGAFGEREGRGGGSGMGVSEPLSGVWAHLGVGVCECQIARPISFAPMLLLNVEE